MLLHSELFFMFSCVFSMKNLWVLEGVPCRPPHPAGRLPSWQPPRQPRHRHHRPHHHHLHPGHIIISFVSKKRTRGKEWSYQTRNRLTNIDKLEKKQTDRY